MDPNWIQTQPLNFPQEVGGARNHGVGLSPIELAECRIQKGSKDWALYLFVLCSTLAVHFFSVEAGHFAAADSSMR